MRSFFKLMVGCILIAGDVTVQLILLIVFNLVYLIYTLCFTPSKNTLTNMLNAFLMVGFIALEVVLFIYNNSTMSASYQNTISIALLSIMALMLFVVILWIIYRLVGFIR